MDKTILKIAGIIFMLLVLIKVFNVSYPISIRVVNTNESSEFSVVGSGEVEIVPDVAVVDAGITVNNLATAEKVKDEMAKVNNAVLKAVKALGIEEKDIKTSNYSTYPEYRIDVEPDFMERSVESTEMTLPAVAQPSKISGYSGNTSISVKIRESSKASSVVEAITKAGATNVNGPRFTVDSPEKYREQARKKAIDDAREQAKKLSKELGISLGKVTNMIETGSEMPYYGRGGVAMTEAKDTLSNQIPEFEEGIETISTSITLFFEKK